jgi:riboflavin biosynthesis pyrimidine reductase
MTASLVEKGLVDEMRVMLHPVALGDGKSLSKP